MSLFLLVFAVCLLISVVVVMILMVSRTPRYRTEPEDLLKLFDKALESRVSETEWNTIAGYPIRHNEYLEGVRRRAQRLMTEHGRHWQVAQGKSLLDQTGREELAALRDHLEAHIRLHRQQRDER